MALQSNSSCQQENSHSVWEQNEYEHPDTFILQQAGRQRGSRRLLEAGGKELEVHEQCWYFRAQRPLSRQCGMGKASGFWGPTQSIRPPVEFLSTCPGWEEVLWAEESESFLSLCYIAPCRFFMPAVSVLSNQHWRKSFRVSSV